MLGEQLNWLKALGILVVVLGLFIRQADNRQPAK